MTVPGDPHLHTGTRADWHMLWWLPILVAVMLAWVQGTMP